ncbi:MAG: sporulation integral membrane protein YlbJ [Paenibacillaceae bacterium]
MHISPAYKYMLMLLPWIILICLMPLYPQQSLTSAIQGISIWWDVLFPALFPFFIISELLLGLGLVHFIGGLFDPMMRPVFRIPGYGGFVMAMGFAAGYPVSARLTSQLWDRQLINRDEAERLLAFTSTSDPIFLVGAVAVGFFHNPSLAVIFVLSHYGGGLILGLLMRFHGQHNAAASSSIIKPQGSIIKNAFLAMHKARIQDGRSLGVMLQQAIQTSLKLVFMIGGLVIFVSVILEQLSLIGVMNVTYTSFAYLLQFVNLPTQLSPSVVNGLFEVTLGAKAAGGAAPSIPLIHKVAIASFILSWAGLCVHAQITSLLTQTNLRYTPFVIARFLHGLIAMLLVYILWIPTEALRASIQLTIPVSSMNTFNPSFQLSSMIIFGIASIPLLLIPICYIVFASIKRLFLSTSRTDM